MFNNRFLLVLGLLSLLLVAMAVSRTSSNAPTSAELSWPPRPVIASGADSLSIQRGREADSARLKTMAEYYLNIEEAQQIQRGRVADGLRWTAIAKYYR